MQQYLDLLQDILDNGSDVGDRTGTGTRSVFGRQLRFDLSEGFPILTTKNVFFRGIYAELRWMLAGDTNVKALQEQRVHIWDEWQIPVHNFGPPSDRRSPTWVPVREPTGAEHYEGDYSRAGLAAPRGSEDDKLLETWRRMMRRCYDPTHHRYEMYGAKGVRVDSKWHNPAFFLVDATMLPNWKFKQENWNGWEMDKDFYGAGSYGPSTAVWLSTEENNYYTTSTLPVEVISPDGEKQLFVSSAHACRELDISTSNLSRWLERAQPLQGLKGANKAWAGWTVREAPAKEGHVLRLSTSHGDLGPIYGAQWRGFGGVDQIKALVDSLRNNPDSRRHIVTAWNPAELDQMALTPCHCLFQCRTRPLSGDRMAQQLLTYAPEIFAAEGKELYSRDEADLESLCEGCALPTRALDLQMYQRSADVFLGVPFNIAAYALLTHMLAQVCGFAVGEYVHTFGDVHIYNNHFDQVKEQLSRVPGTLPTLLVSEVVPELEVFGPNHVKLVGYDPQPSISAPVAV